MGDRYAIHWVSPPYFTYLGGNANDIGYDIAVDCCGSMGTYITGYTVSPDFPLLRADDVAFTGSTEAFITRFDSATSDTDLFLILWWR